MSEFRWRVGKAGDGGPAGSIPGTAPPSAPEGRLAPDALPPRRDQHRGQRSHQADAQEDEDGGDAKAQIIRPHGRGGAGILRLACTTHRVQKPQ